MHWSEVPVIECGQPLQRVSGERIFVEPAYYQQGIEGSEPSIWLRREAVALLNQAAGLLPPGRSLVVWDGWRSYQLQERLYEDVQLSIAERTGFTGVKLRMTTERFVSLPSRDPLCPSPHLTGGSVDLTLGDEHGQPVNMEGDFDELSARSRTDYYEHRPGYQEVRDNRRLLCAVMTHVGFSNYPEEWWHFDVGNQFHHHRVGGPARFGLANHFAGSSDRYP